MSILNEFLSANEKDRKRIIVAGDAMIDEYYYVSVKRMSPEFPIPVMLSESTSPNYSLPGGAANVAYQLRFFNVEARLCSLLDKDSFVVFHKKAGLNIDDCEFVATSYGGLIPKKRRFYNKDFPTYRWDIELPKFGLPPDKLAECLSKLFKNTDADVAILSDYDKGVFSGNYHHKLLTSGITTIVDPKDKDIDKWVGCTVFKPNDAEAEYLSGQKDWKLQCDYFVKRLGCYAVVITQEGNGVVGFSHGQYFEYMPKNKVAKAESVIGAGDCFVSLLALALAHNFTVPQAAEIAFQAASLYVRRKHNEPITPRQLLCKDDPIQAKIAPLEEIKNAHGKMVFTNGVFDIMHNGHMETLKFAKSKGDSLVVAVNSDTSVNRLKPGRPFMKLEERMKMLACLEMVDYVISFDEDTPLLLIEELKPDVLVKGGDYKTEDIAGSEIVKEVYIAPTIPDLSTTNLVKKIRAQET
jgi:D-beta-D-heptose 7-phosphate kinase / D-beta-D-heptose 1-phosphate adenosyltransferase